MKYLPAVLLFVLGFVLYVDAQQSGGGAKVVTEVIASTSTAVVKGAPFSAEAVSESVQTLADGNRITHSNTVKMFRDSDGRFRREGGSVSGGGVYTIGSGSATAIAGNFNAVGGGFSDTISIFDPVANVRYFLNPSAKTARKMTMIPGMAEGAVIVNGQSLSPSVKMQIEKDAANRTQVVTLPGIATTEALSTGVGVGLAVSKNSNNSKTESLGTRDFDGVVAEGTRTVTVIPEGSIGNERAIEMVYERWYSKELQLIVYSKYTDPRFGEQTYRLTNINRSEPDRSLFTIPSDYKTASEPTFRVATPTKVQ